VVFQTGNGITLFSFVKQGKANPKLTEEDQLQSYLLASILNFATTKITKEQ